MPSTIGYILDTNVVLDLARASDRGKAIAMKYGLHASLANTMICVVTVGEMLALVRKFSWGNEKQDKLQAILDELVWIDINRHEVLEAYGEIEDYSRATGKAIGQNDVWIAAVAKATGATLLTSDKDFDHLAGSHITRIWLDPTDGVTE